MTTPHTTRPDPVVVQEHLRAVIKLYPAALDMTTGQASSNTLGDYTTGGGINDLSSLLNLSLSRTLNQIDIDIHVYAHILIDAGRTPPRDTSTVGLVKFLIIHIGYFTHGDNAQLAYAFDADTYRWHRELERAADPGGKISIDTGEPCQADKCTGTYRVSIDRDNPLPYDRAAEALRGRDAHCGDNHEHVIRIEMLPMVRRWLANT